MRSKLLIGLLVVLLACWFNVPVSDAGCYACVQQCCEEAVEGTSGKDLCTNNQLCYAGRCSCHSCITQGGACAGTAPSSCENDHDVCEEFQTYLFIPNGAPVESGELFELRVLKRLKRVPAEECGAA